MCGMIDRSDVIVNDVEHVDGSANSVAAHTVVDQHVADSSSSVGAERTQAAPCIEGIQVTANHEPEAVPFARETAPSPMAMEPHAAPLLRGRGRPYGSLNRSTLSRIAYRGTLGSARAQRQASLLGDPMDIDDE